MISEIRFANSYSSFWRVTLPFGESYVRRMNTQLAPLSAYRFEERTSKRNALISDIGFRMFVLCTERNIARLSDKGRDIETFHQLANESWHYVNRLKRVDVELSLPDQSEIEEAMRLANSLLNYFNKDELGQPIVASPAFSGCGIVDNCEGDILVGSTLYEIKNVDRLFRLTDIRQVLIYCILNYMSKQFDVDSICLLNPRLGRYYKVDLSSLVVSVSSRSINDLFSHVVEFLASERDVQGVL